jgi:hypothetical protein
MKPAAVLFGILLLVAFSPAPRAAAQRWQIDLAGSSAVHGNGAALPSLLVASVLEWDRPDGYRVLGGGVTAFEQSRWGAHLRGDAARLFSPLGAARPWHVELTGGLSASRHSDGHHSALTRGELRAHWSNKSWGLWAGGQAATGWTSDVTAALGPSAGLWTRIGRWNAVGTWEQYRLRGTSYSEGQGNAIGSIGPVDLTLYAGWRSMSDDISAKTVGWGGASVAVWLTTNLAIVTAAGNFQQDPLQGLEGGRYLSAALRVSSGRRTAWTRPGGERVLYKAAPGLNELRFRVPGAQRVAVVGDWTRWRPVRLARGKDGQWIAKVRITKGVYLFNLLVDGNRWTVPEDAVVVDDGFGGKAALLIVP